MSSRAIKGKRQCIRAAVFVNLCCGLSSILCSFDWFSLLCALTAMLNTVPICYPEAFVL